VTQLASGHLSKAFDRDAFRRKCEELAPKLSDIPPETRDALALVMKFVDRVIKVQAGGSLTALRAYRSYQNWSTALNVTPMSFISFNGNLKGFLTEFGGERITREQSPEKCDTWHGITL
jgi:hypothetical protein